ncbi:MAG: AMP-binding protein, partial [Dehalococcoidales bacterium]|nr:AMP-binding protein [Dehalococcoidales bacterium]
MLQYPQTLNAVLESTVHHHGGSPAIIAGDREMTFGQLDEEASRFACALLRMGFRKGDRVALLLSNIPQFAGVFFGIMKAGGIAVPLDTRYVPDELECLFNDCQPKVAVVEVQALGSTFRQVLARFGSRQKFITVGEKTGGLPVYDELIAESPPQETGIPPDPGDPAIIAYTSGPTFDPHGVVLSHRSLCIEAACSAQAMHQTEKDVMMLFALPMYHQFGLV